MVKSNAAFFSARASVEVGLIINKMAILAGVRPIKSPFGGEGAEVKWRGLANGGGALTLAEALGTFGKEDLMFVGLKVGRG